MAVSSTHTGFRRDRANSRLDIYYEGTRVGHVDSSGQTLTGGSTVSGNIVSSTGDVRSTAGNYRGGPVNAFATTEPTQAVVLEAGTAPAGAITTSSGIFASATVLRKIIAAGTVSDVG